MEPRTPSASGIVIIGAGGFAREILDVLRALRHGVGGEIMAGWIVDAQFNRGPVMGLPVLGDLMWLIEHRSDFEAICGIGEPRVRRRMVEEGGGRGGAIRVGHASHRSYRRPPGGRVWERDDRTWVRRDSWLHSHQHDPNWTTRAPESRLYGWTRCGHRRLCRRRPRGFTSAATST